MSKINCIIKYRYLINAIFTKNQEWLMLHLQRVISTQIFFIQSGTVNIYPIDDTGRDAGGFSLITDNMAEKWVERQLHQPFIEL